MSNNKDVLTPVETTWEDEVSKENPVLCWVSNRSKREKQHARNILFISNDDCFCYNAKKYAFKYATPVLPTDCRNIDKAA